VGFSKGGTSSDFTKGKEKVTEPQHPKRLRSIKCFKYLGHEHIASECSNKRVMVVHGKHRELVSSDEAKTKVEDKHGEDFEPTKGDLLVVQRVLDAQIDVSEEQRENIFHTRCQI